MHFAFRKFIDKSPNANVTHFDGRFATAHVKLHL